MDIIHADFIEISDGKAFNQGGVWVERKSENLSYKDTVDVKKRLLQMDDIMKYYYICNRCV
jgi:hypothetical protein